ncbi:MAG: hypothetical protein LBT79_01235, partial [Elusimicrobiota bacterium]|nr:hypothetical protein [Elusimicrobiota bacterium]
MKNLYRYCCSNIRVYVLTVMKRMHKSPTYRLPKNIKNIIVFILRFAKIFFEFLALKRVYLPYLEISLTTRCSLKCKDCSYYMPNIKEDSHKSLSFEDFKLYIDNLLQNVKRL